MASLRSASQLGGGKCCLGAQNELALEVPQDSRVVRTDLRQNIAKMRGLVPRPVEVTLSPSDLCQVVDPFTCLPVFREDLLKVAEVSGLPVLDPWRSVKIRGSAKSLQKDSRHYTDSFLDVAVDPVVEFAPQVSNCQQPARRPA